MVERHTGATSPSRRIRSDSAKPSFLITGGAGFIGSHLCEFLLARGYQVSAMDNLSTGKLENIKHLVGTPGFHFARADILDSIVLDRMTSQADIIVHLAAMVGVERIISQPVQTIETNVHGTEVVLQAALRYGCRVLIASTSEVYGKSDKAPFSEGDDLLLGPTTKNRWSYAASKIVDEFLGFAYAHEYGLEIVVMRFFNTVGPRQTGQYGMVIPRLMAQALKGEPLTVYGDGQQSRCFCDVRDVVRAIHGLSIHPASPGKVANIGSQREISIMQLAQRINAMTGNKAAVRMVPYDEAYAPGFEDVRRRVPDTATVKRLIGWQPRISFDATLRNVRDQISKELARSGRSARREARKGRRGAPPGQTA